MAAALNLVPAEGNNFLWVVDFPAFEYDEERGGFTFTHNPVSSPRDEDVPLLEEGMDHLRAGRDAAIPPDSPHHPLARVLSKQYDMVLNGAEIGGGSIRIHRSDLQLKVFEILGFTEERARQQFGFLLDALEFGAPPHGGIAFGVDRMVAIMSNAESIREVIAFPKNATGADVMLQAPSLVDDIQLRDLRLRVVHKPVSSGASAAAQESS